jgi:nucleoside-diphosphate-sugar epimerase
MSTVLITGASGFIGTRLAEVAIGRGFDTVGLIRNWSRTARVARVPIRLVRGDVLDRVSLEHAMQGCDSVIHCATDFGARGDEHYRTIVEGTANVVELAARVGLSRVVHVSTAAVHGLFPTTPLLPEHLVTTRTGIPYCDGKLDAEHEATSLAARHGLQLVIVRPTIVYGPWGTHDTRANQLLSERRMMLVDGARGHFNGIYIDNLVDALLAALSSERAPGRIFHLTDDAAVTWRDFLEAHARAIDERMLPLPEPSREALRRAWRGDHAPALQSVPEQVPADVGHKGSGPSWLGKALLAIPGVRRGWRALRGTPEPPSGNDPGAHEAMLAASPVLEHGHAPTLSEHEADLFRIFEQVTFSADAAKAMLGFRSRVSFDEGMARTAAWIRWRSPGTGAT